MFDKTDDDDNDDDDDDKSPAEVRNRTKRWLRDDGEVKLNSTNKQTYEEPVNTRFAKKSLRWL